jgi:hypothetical protein
MRTVVNFVAVITFFLSISFSAGAAERANPASIELPEEAFSLLAESFTQDCILCAKQMRKVAFRILTNRFKAGDVIRSDDSCLFVRSPLCGLQELMLTCYPKAQENGKPLLSFRFHTAQNKLVGIAEKDITANHFAEIYSAAPVGASFTGELEIVPFRYGDGKTFNYHVKENVVEVHCKIRSLKPLDSAAGAEKL